MMWNVYFNFFLLLAVHLVKVVSFTVRFPFQISPRWNSCASGNVRLNKCMSCLRVKEETGEQQMRCADEKNDWTVTSENLQKLYDSLEENGDITIVYSIEELMEHKLNNKTRTTPLYNILLSSWSRMTSHFIDGTALVNGGESGIYLAEDAALRAETILLKEIPKPDKKSYNIVIDTWAKTSNYRRAEKIFELVQFPTLESYNGILTAYSNCDDSESVIVAEKAEKLLERMTSDSSNVNADLDSYNTLIKIWCNTVSNSAYDDYIGDLQNKASSRVLKLLQQLKDDPHLNPSETTYTEAINCLARCDLPYECEKLLLQLKKPNVRVYAAVINAWSWSSDKEIAPKKAEALVSQMESSLIQPDAKVYTALISCWAYSSSSNKASKAFQIFQQVLKKYNATKDETIKPTDNMYNSAIEACKVPHKVYNNVNETRTVTQIQNEALQIAFDVFQTLRKDKTCRPNSKIYASLIKVTRNTLPRGKERNDILSAVFKRCCKEGYVDKIVLKQLRHAVDTATYVSLLGKEKYDINGKQVLKRIPRSWRRNVDQWG